MKYILGVCLIALTLSTNIAISVAATGTEGVVEIESQWTRGKGRRWGSCRWFVRIKTPALSHQRTVRQGRGTLRIE